MITLNVLSPIPSGTAPRSGPTVKTEVDQKNIAFIQYVAWVKTDAKDQYFRNLMRGEKLAPGEVPILLVYLVDVEDNKGDTAGIVYKYQPVSVLPVPVGIEQAVRDIDFMMSLSDFIEVPIDKVDQAQVDRNIDLKIDGKRYRHFPPNKDGTGTGWVNANSITKAGEGFVAVGVRENYCFYFKNYHRLPIARSYYTVFIGYDIITYRNIAGRLYPQVSLVGRVLQPKYGDDPVYDMTELAASADSITGPLLLDATSLEIYTAQYKILGKDGISRAAVVGKNDDDKGIPYIEFVLSSGAKVEFPDGETRRPNRLAVIRPRMDQFLPIMYKSQADNMYHAITPDGGDSWCDIFSALSITPIVDGDGLNTLIEFAHVNGYATSLRVKTDMRILERFEQWTNNDQETGKNLDNDELTLARKYVVFDSFDRVPEWEPDCPYNFLQRDTFPVLVMKDSIRKSIRNPDGTFLLDVSIEGAAVRQLRVKLDTFTRTMIDDVIAKQL
jgi:hypothetical protein